MPIYFLCGLPVECVCNNCGEKTTRRGSDDKNWAEGWIAKDEENNCVICPKCLKKALVAGDSHLQDCLRDLEQAAREAGSKIEVRPL